MMIIAYQGKVPMFIVFYYNVVALCHCTTIIHWLDYVIRVVDVVYAFVI